YRSLAVTSDVIPGHFPAGSRVSFRVLSAAEPGKEISFRACAFRELVPCGPPVSWGANPAVAQGVMLDYAGSANTFGAWTPLAEDIADDLVGVAIYPQLGGDT